MWLLLWLLLLWLLLLSGHKSGEEQEGESGERRASTRRPARTRHCGRVWGSVGSLGQAARAREMEHPQAVMEAKGWVRRGAGKDARGSEFRTILRPRGGGGTRLLQLSVGTISWGPVGASSAHPSLLLAFRLLVHTLARFPRFGRHRPSIHIIHPLPNAGTERRRAIPFHPCPVPCACALGRGSNGGPVPAEMETRLHPHAMDSHCPPASPRRQDACHRSQNQSTHPPRPRRPWWRSR